MKDPIERQEAIERIVSMRPSTPKQSDYSHGIDVGMAMAIVAIEEQPSAHTELRWIPCSERLPKKNCRYMVTRYDYVTKKEFIDILWYDKKIWWNVHPMGEDYAVTAWMPLPEPYQEGDVE